MHKRLKEGQLLKYIGKGRENIDQDKAVMKFLGYDSNSWDDIWIEYDGQKLYVSCSEIEIIESPD